MSEEKLAGGYIVCTNCGERSVAENDGNLTEASCGYCGKNKLVKVEVRILSDRAHADAVRVGASNAFMWGIIFLLFGAGRWDVALMGAAFGFGYGYLTERKGWNRLR